MNPFFELAERVHKLQASDRGIDAEIHWHINDGVGVGCRQDAPAYTSSIDAALALLPKGSLWSTCHMEDGPSAQVIRPMPGGGFVNGFTKATAATAALAICAAALRALAANNNHEGSQS
jgi:hypothetical protein